MSNKKAVFGLLSILTIPSVFAISLDPLTDLMQLIFDVGSFVWVTDKLSATKFAIFVILFAVLYGVLNKGLHYAGRSSSASSNKFGVLGGDEKTTHKVAVVVAFAMAALTVIFIPDVTVLSIGSIYSAIAALLLIGLPVGGLIYIAYSEKMLFKWLGGTRRTAVAHGSVATLPPKRKWILHGIRLLIALLALSLVTGIATEYGYAAIILPIMWRKNK